MADSSKDTPPKDADQEQQAAPSVEQIAAAITPAPPPVQPIPGLDETVPGGAYRLQSGDWVNAEGQPIKAPTGKG